MIQNDDKESYPNHFTGSNPRQTEILMCNTNTQHPFPRTLEHSLSHSLRILQELSLETEQGKPSRACYQKGNSCSFFFSWKLVERVFSPSIAAMAERKHALLT